MRQLGGVAALLLIVATMAGCSSKPASTNETTTSAEVVATIPVPDLTGMQGDEARDAVEALGLEVEWDAGDQTAIMASNWTVTGQAPAAGTTLPVGETVTVSVAKPTPTAEPAQAPAPAPAVEATSAGLQLGAATIACEHYGEAMYPYGFKPHWIIGLINSEIVNDQWFLKAEVSIENEFGNDYDTVLECTVGGSNDAPTVSEFFVYP